MSEKHTYTVCVYLLLWRNWPFNNLPLNCVDGNRTTLPLSGQNISASCCTHWKIWAFSQDLLIPPPLHTWSVKRFQSSHPWCVWARSQFSSSLNPLASPWSFKLRSRWFLLHSCIKFSNCSRYPCSLTPTPLTHLTTAESLKRLCRWQNSDVNGKSEVHKVRNGEPHGKISNPEQLLT